MAVRRLLGYVPQQLSIEAALTGRENVTWFARLFDVPRRERKERVADALEVMGLADAADRLAGTYSGGMVRRLELAQALVNRPALLVLDEPTVGLDPLARDGVWQRVEELRGQTGMTVLLTTHYMEEADALCDRVALMHLGTIRAVGSPDELQARARPGRDARGRVPPLHRAARSTATRSRREVCVRSAALAGPPAASAELRLAAARGLVAPLSRAGSATFCLVELQKLSHDRTELVHARRAAGPVAGHLRRDVQPHPRDPDRRHSRTSTSSRPGSSPSRACSSRSSTASRSSGSATRAS